MEKIQLRAEPRIARPHWMGGDSSMDFEDEGENGGYFNKCHACHGDFIGHKHRITCRKCEQAWQYKWAAMSIAEKSGHMKKTKAEIEEFFKQQPEKKDGL